MQRVKNKSKNKVRLDFVLSLHVIGLVGSAEFHRFIDQNFHNSNDGLNNWKMDEKFK